MAETTGIAKYVNRLLIDERNTRIVCYGLLILLSKGASPRQENIFAELFNTAFGCLVMMALEVIIDMFQPQDYRMERVLPLWIASFVCSRALRDYCVTLSNTH